MRVRPLAAVLAAVAVVAVVAGCTTSGLQDSYSGTGNQNYVSGDGVQLFKSNDKLKTVRFSGETAEGKSWSSNDVKGDVVVVNFWYAGCPPCRSEAKDLEAVYTSFAGKDVAFIGVNTTDTAATVTGFNDNHGITYPSLLDVNTGAVALAFAGIVAPDAVPTTVVLDKQGRVIARISGQLQAKSILSSIVSDALAAQR